MYIFKVSININIGHLVRDSLRLPIILVLGSTPGVCAMVD